MIRENEDDLVFYLIFLRLFPGSPNWAMNLSFPHLGISNSKFIMTVFIGIAPWNFFACSSGDLISTLASTKEIMGLSQYLQVSFVLISAFIFMFNSHRNTNCKEDLHEKIE